MRDQVTVDTVPSVSIAAMDKPKANPSDKLVLQATVKNSAPGLSVQATWSLLSGGFASGDLTGVATTSVVTLIDAGVEAKTLFLVLRANSMSSGASYNFQLFAEYPTVRDSTPG